MKILMILSLFFLQDDKKAERERMELLKKIAPAMGGIGEVSRSSSRPLGYLTRSRTDLDSALLDYAKALEGTGARISWTTASGTRVAGRLALTLHESEGRVAGFFIDAKGSFLTTSEALEYFDGTVTLSDGRRAKAQVVTRDAKIGLAVLRVEGESSKPLPLGDSSAIEAGRTAIVSTFAGESPVLRQAVVIDRPRRGLDLTGIENPIHIDYPALPGEIGAAVLNLDGEVIGILAAPAWEKGTLDGATATVPRRAYVIPTATIKAFLAKRDAQGKFELGYMGVTMEGTDKGVQLSRVEPEGPAGKAGLQSGDVVVGVDGRAVREQRELTRIIRFKAHEVVEFEVRRGDATLKIKGMVGVYEEPKPEPDWEQTLRERLGFEAIELTPDLKKFLEVPSDKGLVVQKVHASGPASDLRKADVVTGINNQPAGPDEVKKLAKLPKGEYVVLETYRDGKRVPVVVQLR